MMHGGEYDIPQAAIGGLADRRNLDLHPRSDSYSIIICIIFVIFIIFIIFIAF